MVVGADSKVEVRRVEPSPAPSAGKRGDRDGLQEGENVIVEGINKVRPGILVDAAVATGG